MQCHFLPANNKCNIGAHWFPPPWATTSPPGSGRSNAARCSRRSKTSRASTRRGSCCLPPLLETGARVQYPPRWHSEGRQRPRPGNHHARTWALHVLQSCAAMVASWHSSMQSGSSLMRQCAQQITASLMFRSGGGSTAEAVLRVQGTVRPTKAPTRSR